jgi:UDP-N-acetylglucosamine--N-acetylmuramyl-(pentapeptide) pyrophosphoryl-undecaprenol N-acetylglucosamine transferase
VVATKLSVLLRIIISGGGSGGHIFPAIAIANQIKEQHPTAEILFVGAKGKMEMEKVPKAGYKIEGLWISGIQRKLTLANLSFPFKLISSLYNSNKIIRKFKPDLAIGVGGYASGPLLRAAAAKNIPTLIQEQNSFPGITNRWLSSKVDKICVAYENMERFFPKSKISKTGNPVRMEMVNIAGKRSEALSHFGLSDNMKTVLVVGGSLGARTINQALSAHVEEIQSQNIQVIWQTGKFYFNDIQEAMSSKDLSKVKVTEFIDRMDLAYAAADVVISRAGAMSISELCLVAKPTILVPSPNVSEDHQTKNAMALVNNEAAVLIKDKDLVEELPTILKKLILNEAGLVKLSKNISQMADKSATEDIVNHALSLVKK